jgi:hypothetical protein
VVQWLAEDIDADSMFTGRFISSFGLPNPSAQTAAASLAADPDAAFFIINFTEDEPARAAPSEHERVRKYCERLLHRINIKSLSPSFLLRFRGMPSSLRDLTFLDFSHKVADTVNFAVSTATSLRAAAPFRVATTMHAGTVDFDLGICGATDPVLGRLCGPVQTPATDARLAIVDSVLDRTRPASRPASTGATQSVGARLRTRHGNPVMQRSRCLDSWDHESGLLVGRHCMHERFVGRRHD